MEVESVSDELYGLPLDDFTSAHSDREKQTKPPARKIWPRRSIIDRSHFGWRLRSITTTEPAWARR